MSQQSTRMSATLGIGTQTLMLQSPDVPSNVVSVSELQTLRAEQIQQHVCESDLKQETSHESGHKQ